MLARVVAEDQWGDPAVIQDGLMVAQTRAGGGDGEGARFKSYLEGKTTGRCKE